MRNKSYVVATFDKDNYCILQRRYKCNSKDKAIEMFQSYYSGKNNYASSNDYLKAFDDSEKDKEGFHKHLDRLKRHLIHQLGIDSRYSHNYRVYVGDKFSEMSLNNFEARILGNILDRTSDNLINIERLD